LHKSAIIIVFLLSLNLFSCAKKEKQQTISDADSLLNVKQDNLLPADAPAWYVQKPQTSGYFYGKGMARSKRVTVARDKAMLQAQAELAKEIKNDSLSIDISELKNSIIKQQKQIQEGKHWRVYVLLEMPVDSGKGITQ